MADPRAALEALVPLVRRHTHDDRHVILTRAGNVNDCLLCRALVEAGVLTLDDIGAPTRAALAAPEALLRLKADIRAAIDRRDYHGACVLIDRLPDRVPPAWQPCEWHCPPGCKGDGR